MQINKEIKELAKEIHKAEHRFVEGKPYDKKHKPEDYYYLLGSLVFTKLKDSIESSNVELFNKIVDLQNEVRDLSKQMKELSKQQKYLWQTQKATDIFTNCESWKPKPMCSPKSPCHVRAPRGSRYGIQGGMSGFRKNRPNQKNPDISMLKKYRRDSLHPADMGDSVGWNATVKRGIVPKELCLEILQSCEQLIATPSDSPSASANAEDLISVKEEFQK